MEIAPIAGIRVAPAPKPRPAEPELTALFETEAVARLGDDTYTSAGKKGAGAEEDEEEGLDAAEDEELEANARRSVEPDEASSINLFA